MTPQEQQQHEASFHAQQTAKVRESWTKVIDGYFELPDSIRTPILDLGPNLDAGMVLYYAIVGMMTDDLDGYVEWASWTADGRQRWQRDSDTSTATIRADLDARRLVAKDE